MPVSPAIRRAAVRWCCVISVAGKMHWLWRAVDEDGFVLDPIGGRTADHQHGRLVGRIDLTPVLNMAAGRYPAHGDSDSLVEERRFEPSVPSCEGVTSSRGSEGPEVDYDSLLGPVLLGGGPRVRISFPRAVSLSLQVKFAAAARKRRFVPAV